MAKQVLQQKEHTIDMEEFRLRVQVQPLELPMLTTIQVTKWQGPGTCRGPQTPGAQENGAVLGTAPSCLLLGGQPDE